MRPGALLAISGLFAVSLTGKAAILVGDAVAAAPSKAAKPLPTSDPAAAAHEVIANIEPENICEAGPSALAQKLKIRIEENESLKSSLDERAAIIAVAETRAKERIAELEVAQQKLAASLARLDQASADDITALVRMYQAMKPSQAGAIFNEMEPSFAAGFLTRMNSESAALVLANMESGKAYTVSVVIAGNAAKLKQR